ncbi:MAG: FAD-dependent oxidoreductase [Actinobacteria bacterium]|uniref:Pyridine nucleotide-disulfide oxidoreductase domain-containing protein 2 n=1 Tax=freshwater metagenome TaxID=449393 RepID=A0A6J7DAU2_9ZZZZ|nr:FAD-dependent oxidoreductase [Actinomycetota bacterium]
MITQADCVIIGGGHNGLVAACYLAKAGRSVILLEARDVVGGAAISAEVFEGVNARLSKYSYLVSLLPAHIREDLDIELTTARRSVSSYTPDPKDPSRGLSVPVDNDAAFDAEMTRLTGSTADADAWRAFYARTADMAKRVFPTLTEPLRSRAQMRELVGDDASWNDFIERPLGEVLERDFDDDVVRGIVFTDALIGTFSGAHDENLNQNKCFLYHVIGNGTGDWDVPIGGMGALTGALADRARSLGVEIRTGVTVTSVSSDGVRAVVTASGDAGEITITCADVLANCAPRVLEKLLGRAPGAPIEPAEAGAQIKVNMLLARLPKLLDESVDPLDAFAGTFHINESYEQLESAFALATGGELASPIPAEIYCHSLSDPSILGPELQQAGAQTLTVFALHTPHGLFADDNDRMRQVALDAVIASLNTVLAEPIEDCLWRDAQGNACIEVNTTVDIENALNIPTGNIFHTPLDWPFADEESEVGTWGVETDIANITLCGAGARRGGGVSGVPGHNAAAYVLKRLQ